MLWPYQLWTQCSTHDRKCYFFVTLFRYWSFGKHNRTDEIQPCSMRHLVCPLPSFHRAALKRQKSLTVFGFVTGVEGKCECISRLSNGQAPSILFRSVACWRIFFFTKFVRTVRMDEIRAGPLLSVACCVDLELCRLIVQLQVDCRI